jgi:hypothetical protein
VLAEASYEEAFVGLVDILHDVFKILRNPPSIK